MRVLVCGGGVIGASVAFFLAARGVEVTVIERTGIACAASGKSGGFLALDWCDGTALERFARRSFELHAKLAEEMTQAYGYRRVTTYGGRCGRQTDRVAGAPISSWLSPDVRLDGRLGSTATTAQVHPALFTKALMQAAGERGANLRLGQVTGILRSEDGRVLGARVDEDELMGDAVVIAMGPWSVLAAQWLPVPPVFGLKGHSLVFETGQSVPPEALFLEYREPNGALLSPEVFPRADGTTYVCAVSSETPLPIDPDEVAPDPGAMDRLQRLCTSIAPVLARSKVVAAQACYRPVTQDGLPLIGRVPGASGAYVATGHSVWGILNAPATGEAVAELILDGASRSVDLSPFDPARLPALDPARLSRTEFRRA